MKKSILFFALIFCAGFLSAQQLAFPGAEGYGKYAKGGRGGSVYHVTNLNDSGAGSFRDAVSQPKRTVVFDVNGVIKIQSKLTVSSFITIAGQTAPGDGIVVYGNGISMTGATDVIIRYIRFRGSVAMGKGACTVSSDNTKDIIFDHVSIEWGRWDNFHIKDSKDITVQYCLIGEGINPQMFGALLENPTNLTIHHCLWVDNQSRNPKAKAGIEIINNVIYNWGSNGLVGGHSGALHHQDIINNYFIAGPNSGHAFIGMFTATDHVYQKGNLVDMNKDGILNGRLVTDEDFLNTGATLETKAQNTSFTVSNIEQPEVAYAKVIAQAGASLHRDEIDNRLVSYVKSLGKEGKVIKAEAEVGGQIEFKNVSALKDTDGDGIPDSWESKHHLNPKKAPDANLVNKDGYTNLEEYLNELVAQK
jgi:pectate lyase